MFRKMMLTIVATIIANPVFSGPWFTHEFGELRAYHDDFLNVCAENGMGQCRTVQHLFDSERPSSFGKTFFGVARLSVYRMVDGGYALEFYNVDWPDVPASPFSITIDGRSFDLPEIAWHRLNPEGYNVSETVSVNNTALTGPVLAAMKRGFFLTVENSEAKMVFSLKGLTSALNAIESHIRTRNH